MELEDPINIVFQQKFYRENLQQKANELIAVLGESIQCIESTIYKTVEDLTFEEPKGQNQSAKASFKFEGCGKVNGLAQSFIHRNILRKSLESQRLCEEAIIHTKQLTQQIVGSIQAFDSAMSGKLELFEQQIRQEIESFMFGKESMSPNLELVDQLTIKNRHLNYKEQEQFKNAAYKSVFQHPLSLNQSFEFRIETKEFSAKDSNYFEFGCIDSAFQDLFISKQSISSPRVFQLKLSIKNYDKSYYFVSQNRAKLISLCPSCEYFGLKLGSQGLTFYGVELVLYDRDTDSVLSVKEAKSKIEKYPQTPRQKLLYQKEKTHRILEVSTPEVMKKSVLKPFFGFFGFSCKVFVRERKAVENSESKTTQT